MSTHLPQRPGWTCTVDGQPWPCQAARHELRTIWQHDPVGLALHMSDRLYEAVTELHQVSPQELYDRFLAWARY